MQALEALFRYVTAAAPPFVDGQSLLQSLLSHSRLLPIGCPDLDDGLLGGGLREGQLAELCGDTASGKTQLCLSTAALAARRGERVVWVDTSNAFSGGRLAQLLEALRPPAEPREASQAALRLVEVHRTYDLHTLLRLLSQLQAEVRRAATAAAAQHQQQAAAAAAEPVLGSGRGACEPRAAAPQAATPSPLKLLVVDSLSALVTPVLGGSSGGGGHGQGHALLAQAGAALKRLAADAGAVAVVTNHMVGGRDAPGERQEQQQQQQQQGGAPRRREARRPAMGESWRNQPHVRLVLARGEGGAPHTATLAAHTSSFPGPCVRFWLSERGPVDQPPGAPEL